MVMMRAVLTVAALRVGERGKDWIRAHDCFAYMRSARQSCDQPIRIPCWVAVSGAVSLVGITDAVLRSRERGDGAVCSHGYRTEVVQVGP